MGYIDLIPDVFRLTMPDLATGKSYHTQKFNVGNKQCIGVTIKASQALSVAVAYGIATDTAAAAGVDIAASLPYKTSATSFASNTSTEGGTYHEIAVPPHARQAQLVISNASGSTVSGAVIDAALRVVAYPASGGGGDFASITGWPGSSSQVVRADGSYSALSAADILTALGSGKYPIFTMASVAGTGNAITATVANVTLAAGQFFWLPVWTTSSSTTVNINLNSGGNARVKGPDGSTDPASGDLIAGRLVLLYYDGTAYRLLLGAPVSTTDSTKLPLAGYSSGSAAMTGALAWTGTQSSPGSGITAAFRDVSGNLIFNVNTSSAVQFGAGNYVTVGINDRGIGFTQDCNLMSAAVGIARYATGLVLQTTTVGCINQQAKLQTRANSTAYSICSHVTNDISRIIIQDSLGRRAVALIDGSGTVTFESGSHADYVASSSPASGEVGIYVASPGATGVATAKPGSAATRGIAFWAFRGIA